jgi:hypothetical protein
MISRKSFFDFVRNQRGEASMIGAMFGLLLLGLISVVVLNQQIDHNQNKFLRNAEVETGYQTMVLALAAENMVVADPPASNPSLYIVNNGQYEVPVSTLQSSGFLSDAFLDTTPFGQTLTAYTALTYNPANTGHKPPIVVLQSTPPTALNLGRFGYNEPSSWLGSPAWATVMAGIAAHEAYAAQLYGSVHKDAAAAILTQTGSGVINGATLIAPNGTFDLSAANYIAPAWAATGPAGGGNIITMATLFAVVSPQPTPTVSSVGTATIP